jgi:glycosyltransferase involved in cell wall biosynthesis
MRDAELSVANGQSERPGGRLKVCIASMAPFVGGAEIAAERLAVGLQAAGHEVLIVLGTRGDVYERMVRAGLRCVHAPMHFTDKWHWLRYWRARRGVGRLFRREQPDIVHSNDLPTHQIVSDALRATAIPEVCHHRWVFDGAAIDWLNKFGCPHHLFVSRALMDHLCARSPTFRASSRAVVYDGLPLPPRPSPASRLEARQRLGLPLDRPVVTFAGQFIARKGVADLLRAWCLLDRPLRHHAELLLIGDDLAGQGKYRAEMEGLARQLDCRARFPGFQKDVGMWLLASDLAVVPSHAEPLGNATLEAMAFALPVIGSAVGGIPEMVVHDQTGLLVPPCSPEQLAGALRRLLLNPQTRLLLGQQARQRCEECFSLEAHVRAVLQQYRRVMRPQPPSPGLGAAARTRMPSPPGNCTCG